jgi:ribosomal protein L11 methyltransferase
VSAGSSPALLIHFPAGTSAATRDRLVAALADHDLVAIQEDHLSAPTLWTAHFGSDAARQDAASAVAGLAAEDGLRIEPVEVEDDDWARRTQADLPAIRVGRLLVAPPWDMPPSNLIAAPAGTPPPIVVEIEPSRGFGTGHHQSTRLCLVLLQGRSLAAQTVTDVGTGSGVLAIAAAKLGAVFVTAIDVDPDAIENARENISRNGAERVVEAHVRDLTETPLAPADVVTANLTGTLLARHAAALAALVRPGGSLIVAGFTIDEKPLVLEAFEPEFTLTESAQEDDWWALVLVKR